MSYTADQVVAIVVQEVKGLSDLFTSDDYTNARVTAEAELGWTFPVEGFRFIWMKNRIKRHLIYILLFDSAKSFKIKQYNLQHKFEHYRAMIRDMDRDFEEEMAANIAEFAGVDSFKLFGVKIDAGLSYDTTGNETTYDEDRLVKSSLTE